MSSPLLKYWGGDMSPSFPPQSLPLDSLHACLQFLSVLSCISVLLFSVVTRVGVTRGGILVASPFQKTDHLF